MLLWTISAFRPRPALPACNQPLVCVHNARRTKYPTLHRALVSLVRQATPPARPVTAFATIVWQTERLAHPEVGLHALQTTVSTSSAALRRPVRMAAHVLEPMVCVLAQVGGQVTHALAS